MVSVLGTTILLVKLPSFPFSVWLPEAHVEASWPGSVVLAAYALKFATIAFLTFSSLVLTKMEAVSALLMFSVAFATVGMSATPDCKKLIANFSILHMCGTAILLLCPVNSEFFLNFS